MTCLITVHYSGLHSVLVVTNPLQCSVIVHQKKLEAQNAHEMLWLIYRGGSEKLTSGSASLMASAAKAVHDDALRCDYGHKVETV